MNRNICAALMISIFVSIISGCNPGGGDVDVGSNPEVKAAPSRIASQGDEGCLGDRDCALGTYCFQDHCAFDCSADTDCGENESGISGVCSERGRCVFDTSSTDGQKTPELDESLVDVQLDTEATEPIIYHAADASTIEIPVAFEGSVPTSGIAYRMEVLNCETDQNDVIVPTSEACVKTPGAVERRVERFTANDNLLVVDIPNSSADRATLVRLHTSAGNMSVRLEVAHPSAGAYAGHVRIDAFGGTRLPFAFDIATKPPNASIQDAEQVKLRLPVRQELVFSPVNPSSPGHLEEVVVTMEESPTVEGQWVGNVGFNYDMSHAQMLKIDESDRVDRFMRIELSEISRGVIEGRVIDRFKGLMQLNRTDGSYAYPFVAIEGDIRAVRRDNTNLTMSTPQSPPTNATYRPYEADYSVCASTGLFSVCDGVLAGDIVNPAACNGISSSMDFSEASVQEQLDCVEKLYSCVQAHGTTQSSFVELWSASVEAIENGNGGELSEDLENFNQLIDGCDGPDINYEQAGADWEEDTTSTCSSADAQLICLRALAAGASKEAARADVDAAVGLDVFVKTTAESSFADRMRAFGMDQKIRLRWLLTQDALSEFDDPADEYLRSELEFWEENVVNTYIKILRNVLEPASLSILADSEIVSATSGDQLVGLLTELTESWVAAAEVLKTSADRWNAVLDESEEREAKADELYGLATDLYLAAGVLSEFNRTAGASSEESSTPGNGANFLNGDFAILRDVTDAIGQLSRSYNELVFARDAELVFGTSVDPTQGALSALANRRERAASLVTQADQEVNKVLDQAQARAEQIQNIEGQIVEQMENAFDNMTSICGNRNSCDLDSWLSGSCSVPLAFGECGYRTSRAEGEQRRLEDVIGYGSFGQGSASAGQALLHIEDARQAVEVAESDLQGQQARRDQAVADYKRLAAVVHTWADLRAFGLSVTRETVDQMATKRMEGVREIEDFYEQRQKLLSEEQSVAAQVRRAELKLQLQQNRLTQEDYDAKIALLEEVSAATVGATSQWEQFNTGGVRQYYGELRQAQNIRSVATHVQLQGQLASGMFRSAAAGLPHSTFDGFGGARLALMSGATAAEHAYGTSVAFMQNQASSVQLAAQRQHAVEQARLQQLDRDVSTLDILNRTQIEANRAELEEQLNQLGVDMSQYRNMAETSREEIAARRLESRGNFEISRTELEHEIQQLQSNERLEQAEIRAEQERLGDMEKLESAQSRILNEASRLEGLLLRVERAHFNVKQAISEYASNLDRARSTANRIRRLDRRKNSELALRKSPAVLFRFANDLKRAERLVDQARGAMMDWLVAIEYYSVRPFVSLRKDTLLASSPAQLNELRNEYLERENTCGAGAPTEEVVEISLRNYIFNINEERIDPVTGKALSAAEQFRSYVDQNFIPVDKTIRFAPDTDVEEFQQSHHNLITATFPIDLGSFANLRNACNAKIQSVSLNFVGDIRKASGTTGPEFLLVYDGVASLRSCHPNIGELVNQIGADITSFGPISTFENIGKAISGIGGVNEFPSTENILLQERPIGAQYTLVLSQDTPTNQSFDWSQLEDIVMKIRYTHQATYPSNSLCR